MKAYSRAIYPFAEKEGACIESSRQVSHQCVCRINDRTAVSVCLRCSPLCTELIVTAQRHWIQFNNAYIGNKVKVCCVL